MSDAKGPPPKPAGASFLAGILKSASATPTTNQVKPGLETRTCSVCRAPRAEGSNLEVCEFCGGSYLES